VTSLCVESHFGKRRALPPSRHFATPRPGPAKNEPNTQFRRLDSYTRLVYLTTFRCPLREEKERKKSTKRGAYIHTFPSHMQDQQTSAPQIVDLDRGHQRASSVLTPQSVANLPLSSPSPLPDVPLVKQKRASRRARPSTASNLNPITAPSSPSPNPVDSPIASSSSSDSSPSQASSSCRRDPGFGTDSVYKGLRPKSSYHQSLLNLREELHKPSDSGVYHSAAPQSGFRVVR